MLQNSTLFYDQNAGNLISELLDFQIFWGGGGLPRPPLKEGGRKKLVVTAAYYTFSDHL